METSRHADVGGRVLSLRFISARLNYSNEVISRPKMANLRSRHLEWEYLATGGIRRDILSRFVLWRRRFERYILICPGVNDQAWVTRYQVWIRRPSVFRLRYVAVLS